MLDRLEQWHQQHRQIYAPDLWIAEALSVVRLLVYRKFISQTEGEQAIDDRFDLEIQAVPVTRSLCHVERSWLKIPVNS